MNAHITPTDSATRLTNYQFRLIIKIATRQEPICVRADRLKDLSYCTDAVKFEVLKKSRKVDDDTYQALYDIYFGVVEKDDDKPEPKLLTFSEEEARKLARMYKSGSTIAELAAAFRRTEKQIRIKIQNMKQSKKYKEMFTMNKEQKAAAQEQQRKEKFEQIIQSVDAGRPPEPPEPREMPKALKAAGKGFLSTDGGLKLDEEPITAMLRQKIKELGLAQFYADVEITIKPVNPTGMVVTVEE